MRALGVVYEPGPNSHKAQKSNMPNVSKQQPAKNKQKGRSSYSEGHIVPTASGSSLGVFEMKVLQGPCNLPTQNADALMEPLHTAKERLFNQTIPVYPTLSSPCSQLGGRHLHPPSWTSEQ